VGEKNDARIKLLMSRLLKEPMNEEIQEELEKRELVKELKESVEKMKDRERRLRGNSYYGGPT
jgi:hypothetical protein